MLPNWQVIKDIEKTAEAAFLYKKRETLTKCLIL